MVKLDIDLWLKPEDLEQDDEVLILDEGRNATIEQEGDKPAKVVFEIGVQLNNGEKRIWTMNATSQRAVAQVWGTDTSAWIGYKVKVFKSEQNVRGQMKEVIYARVPLPFNQQVSYTSPEEKIT